MEISLLWVSGPIPQPHLHPLPHPSIFFNPILHFQAAPTTEQWPKSFLKSEFFIVIIIIFIFKKIGRDPGFPKSPPTVPHLSRVLLGAEERRPT